MKRHVAILLSALLLLMFAARAQTIALQTDPPLYIVESYPDNWESCCDLVDADGNVVQAHWADSVVRNDEVLIIRQNGLIGYMGYDGNWLAEPQFDDVRNFSEGMAAVQVGGLFGYIDSNYAWVVSPMFDEANLFSGGMAAVKKEGLWGYVDAAGSLVIAPKFDEAGGFSGDYAVVREGGRYGVIDRTGAFRCPPTYERLSLFCDGAFKTEDGGLVVLLDETAEYLSSQTYGRFESGKNGLIKVEKKGLYGLINLRGDVVLKPKYAQIDDYNDCCAIVVYNEIGILGKIQSGLRTLKGMGDYFIVNLQGERLSEEGFWTAAIQGDGVISAENRNGSHLFGFVDGVMREVQAVDSSLNLADYAPFEGQKNAAGAVREDIGFDAAHALPRLDGATALFPVYAAFAQAVYPEDTRYTPYNRSDSADSLLTCSKTDRAYKRLIYGNTDVIFCAQPSDEELELVFIRWMCYNSSMKEARAERKPYPTDLTDDQWREIEPLYSGMRNRKWSKRELTNAVLYIVKTGCQWRQLPHDFPPYQTVYSFFSRGAKSGLWEKILAHLVEKTRKDAGKSAEPHYALIDSQSVKTVADNEERGIDGGKKQKGANVMPS